jgi:hypothetical protein
MILPQSRDNVPIEIHNLMHSLDGRPCATPPVSSAEDVRRVSSRLYRRTNLGAFKSNKRLRYRRRESRYRAELLAVRLPAPMFEGKHEHQDRSQDAASDPFGGGHTVGDQPTGHRRGPSVQPPEGSWAPPDFHLPSSRSSLWLAIAVGGTAALAVASLVLALTRPTASERTPAATASTPAPAEVSAARRQLCDTYKLVARAVDVDTGGQDRALARIATTNGAVMLDNAAANPALEAKPRDAARALAAAYGTLTAVGSNVVATDAQYQAALDDITAKDAVMKSVCANGGS